MLQTIENILDLTLNFTEKESIKLDHLLQGIIAGELDELSIKVDLFIAWQNGRYKPITMNDIIRVMRNEYENKQFSDLCQLFMDFARSETMPDVKKIPSGSILSYQMNLANAKMKVVKLCEERLSDDQKQRFIKEKGSWEKFISDYISKKLYG